MEFLIGREVTGENTIIVPEEYSSVSRIHAKIVIDKDEILLQDLNSTNGTYVNGRGIESKLVTVNDKITLGKETEYIVDLIEIIERYNTIINENKTDYTKEFDELKKIYDEYRKKINKVNELKNIQQITLGVIALVVLIAKTLLDDNKPLLYFVLIFASLIGISVSVYVLVTSKKFPDKKQLIDLEYSSKYRCPKKTCKFKFPLKDDSYSWIKLKHNKKCPNKCGAIYSK